MYALLFVNVLDIPDFLNHDVSDILSLMSSFVACFNRNNHFLYVIT
jgi:hypothetical protein